MFKPMLACSESAHNFFDKLRFPLYASPKLDGIRATVRDGVVYARSNKPIANIHVQEKFKHFEWFDGELIVGDPADKMCFRNTTSVVGSKSKPAEDVNFYVFDHIRFPGLRYSERQTAILGGSGDDVRVLWPQLCNDLDTLIKYEAFVLLKGYEGVILRSPAAGYKFGRSTANEQGMLKLKRFEDAEATIIGFVERMHNGNVATTNELGRTARSSHQENKSGLGDLGALHLLTPNGIEFFCGTGFDDNLRKEIWDNRPKYLGRLTKYKHFPVGAKDLPRHPVFLGFRDKRDMS
ncbi:MAG: ATP-dependent DNA ligase [Candidatus Accumulibacter sp.]|uniref:ATP-dependent DNA ligase n=1 Tax=Accumulibacter sp. TaxID=2053492 RepID=UPI002590156A|nr:ATP-dependent DNA ligase [Accumulibacter sp.]MBK8113163.1 ATP-dependent DNA ligase [Accumulibacter sp.]